MEEDAGVAAAELVGGGLRASSSSSLSSIFSWILVGFLLSISIEFRERRKRCLACEKSLKNLRFILFLLHLPFKWLQSYTQLSFNLAKHGGALRPRLVEAEHTMYGFKFIAKSIGPGPGPIHIYMYIHFYTYIYV